MTTTIAGNRFWSDRLQGYINEVRRFAAGRDGWNAVLTASDGEIARVIVRVRSARGAVAKVAESFGLEPPVRKPCVLASYPSKTTGNRWEVRIAPNGRTYCTCPGWKYSKAVDGKKSCRHLRQADADAARRVRDLLVQLS